MVLAYLKYVGHSPMGAPMHRAIRNPPRALWNERDEEASALADALPGILAALPITPDTTEADTPVPAPVPAPASLKARRLRKRPLAMCTECDWSQAGSYKSVDAMGRQHHEEAGHMVLVFEHHVNVSPTIRHVRHLAA